jgi:hypothetical protein
VRGAIARRLQDDLRALVPPGGLYASGLVGEDAKGSSMDEVLLPPSLQGAPASSGPIDAPPPLDARDRLTLAVAPPATTRGDALPAAQGAFWSVVWEVDDDPATPERGLVRRPVRLRDPLPGALPEPAEVLAEEGLGLSLRYWDGTAWTETWDSGASDLLPLLVEARVALVLDGDLQVLQVLVAPLAARGGATATTGGGP